MSFECDGPGCTAFYLRILMGIPINLNIVWMRALRKLAPSVCPRRRHETHQLTYPK